MTSTADGNLPTKQDHSAQAVGDVADVRASATGQIIDVNVAIARWLLGQRLRDSC
jgi:hypothetical protein